MYYVYNANQISCPYLHILLTSEIVLGIVFIPYLEVSEMSHLLHQIQSRETLLDEIVLYSHGHSSVYRDMTE